MSLPFSIYPGAGQRQKCSPCTVPATERSLLWKQQRDTVRTVRLQLTRPFPNSSPTMLQLGALRTTPCAASQRVLSRIRQAHGPATQRRRPSSLPRRKTLAEKSNTATTMSSLSAYRAACAITALTHAKSGVPEKYSCLFPQRPRGSCATHLDRSCGASSEPLLTVTHLVRLTRHPFSAAADRGTTS